MTFPKSVHTTRFGEVDIDPNKVLQFELPILGFEKFTQFIMLDHGEDSPFQWLQSIEEPSLAFVITNPNRFDIDYTITIPDEILERLDIQSEDDVIVMNIVNIPASNPGLMTANLVGPLVIQVNNLKAAQVILTDTQYDTKTRLIADTRLKVLSTGRTNA
jgi:flagellar assembly factor FliW